MNNQTLQPKGYQHHIIMKRMNMNQVRSWCGILLAGWLLAGFAPTAQSGLFSGAFAPGNWTAAQFGYNPGGYVFTGTGDTAVLVLTAAAAGPSDTILSLNSPYSSTAESVYFNWTLTANGDKNDIPQAYFYVGTTEYPLLSLRGSMSIEIPASTPISFELVGNVLTGKAPAQLEISEVPEAGNALAGLLVLGAAGFEWFRQKRKGGG